MNRRGGLVALLLTIESLGVLAGTPPLVRLWATEGSAMPADPASVVRPIVCAFAQAGRVGWELYRWEGTGAGPYEPVFHSQGEITDCGTP